LSFITGAFWALLGSDNAVIRTAKLKVNNLRICGVI